MRNPSFSRRQIFEVSQLVFVVVILSAGSCLVSAAPIYTPPYYTLTGMTVTGSGISSAAYFNDSGATGYTVNVNAGANLSDAVNSEIEIAGGTVTNKGTLSYTGTDENLGGIVLNTGGTVSNFGTVTAPATYSVQDYGASGVMSNAKAGVLSSAYGTYFAGTATLANLGTITATDPSFGIPIETGGIGTVNNSGTMTGTLYGVQMNFNSTAGTNTVTNSGTISCNAEEGIAVDSVDGTSVTNSGKILATGTSSIGVEAIFESATVMNLKGGTISGGYNGVYCYYVDSASVTNAAGATISGPVGAVEVLGGDATVINGGLLTANDSTIETQGVYVDGAGDVQNTGSISLSNDDLAEGVLLESGSVFNSGTIEVLNSTTTYGIEINGYGFVSMVPSGRIVANGAEGTGIFLGGAASGVYTQGTITGGKYGIFLEGDDSDMVLAEGIVTGGTDSIVLAGSNGVVTIQGRAVTQGTIEGTAPANGNVLQFDLSGLTATQSASFEAYVDAHPNSGSYTLVRNGKPATYTWADFSTVKFY